MTLAGCAGEFGEARESADVNVAPVNPKPQILALLRTYLNNPVGIRDGAVSDPMLRDVGPVSRYVMCLRFDARNSDGKYTGVKDRLAIFRYGRIDQISETARDICSGASYKPFPELASLKAP